MSARVPKEVQAVGGQRNPHMKHNVKVGDSSHCMIDRRILWVQLAPAWSASCRIAGLAACFVSAAMRGSVALYDSLYGLSRKAPPAKACPFVSVDVQLESRLTVTHASSLLQFDLASSRSGAFQVWKIILI